MNFLEAHRLVASFSGGPSLPFLFAMSGTSEKLSLFIQAAAARRGMKAEPRVLQFNTFSQWLLSEPRSTEREVVLMMPWDFVPEADWRSGLPSGTVDEGGLWERAQRTAERISRRVDARVVYIPAPVPPLFAARSANVGLEAGLVSLASHLGAHVLPAECFALGSYLTSGSPFSGSRLGEIAEAIVSRADQAPLAGRKVLVTDLDNVMWQGVIGEDGVDGIRYGPEGSGYRFFIYQTMLARLEREGILLAAVSRNDEALAHAPFRATESMRVSESQFVCILASYSAKSSQIAEIASRLNLGLDAFVFVDDNPLEVAEVAKQLPGVECVQFPAADAELPAFLHRLNELFARATITEEDRRRTEMYRLRLEGIAPSDVEGADLTEFLRELEMRLTIHDRTSGDRARAVQLINKTNQFNLNGRRVTDVEVAEIISAGGRLITAALSDRNGDHGEILACLISARGTVEVLVMSCRVFQRRVEHAFLAWLSAEGSAPTRFAFRETDRNEPMRQFLRNPSFATDTHGDVRMDPVRFSENHAGDLALFTIVRPTDAVSAAEAGDRAGV